MEIYKYGMRLRGFSIGCQPMDGFIRREDDPTGKYHDIIVYDRQLTEKELSDYELDDLKKIKDELHRSNFNEMCDNLNKTWDSLSEFEKDFFSWRVIRKLRVDYQRMFEDYVDSSEMKDRGFAYYCAVVVKIMKNPDDDMIDRLF